MTEDSSITRKEVEDNFQFENNQINFEDLFIKILRRKKIFLLLSGIVFTVSFINLLYRRIAHPVYQGAFTIMISDPIIDKNRDSSSGAIENLAMNKTRSDIPTLIQYLKSTKVLEKVAAQNNISPISLSNRLSIRVPRIQGDLNSYLPSTLRVALNGKNKVELKNILDDLSQTYLQIAFERKSKNLLDGISFLDSEQPKLLKKSNKVQSQLEEFRLKNKLIDPLKEGDFLTTTIEKNQDLILSLESENLRLSFIKQKLDSGILYTPGIKSMGGSSGKAGLGVIGSDQLLLEEILTVKSELAKAQSKYKKSSSIVESLNAKLKQLEPILLENQQSAVEAAIVINQSQIKSAKNKVSELNKRFKLLPAKINEYSSILQNKKIIEGNLESLLTAREKLQLELSQGNLPWNIILEPIVNPKPYKPNLKINFIYILLGTISFSTLLTLLIDRFDNVFHNPKEVEKILKSPILGFVPFFNFKKDEEMYDFIKSKDVSKEITIEDFVNKENEGVLNNINFVFQETFRNIYTSIKFSISDKEIKTICFTSTIPQEGKSLCSLFLAMNASEISKKILIIDTDLRRPALHKKLNVDNVSGITNYLVNIDKNWKEFIQQHNEFKNLFFITAGKIPPNSVRLLNSNRMKKLVEELRDCNEYDLIIFDCPPVLGLSDSLIISNLVDGTILTVSLDKVDRTLTQETLKKLQSTSTPVIGTIANAANKPRSAGLNSNKFGYYGDYRYQYKYNAYKYMPEETSERYSSVNLKTENKTKLNLSKFNSLSFKEKANFLYQKIVSWINE